MKGILIVRKYKNRRLYDTERSCHITRGELLEIVRAGRDVQVQEAASGENVTSETLLQIILADSGLTSDLLPADFLTFLIRSEPRQISRFFKEFLPTAMRQFGESWNTVRGHQDRLSRTFLDMASMAYPWVPWAKPAPDGAVRSPGDDTGSAASGEGPKAGEDGLEIRLERLEAELKRLKKKS